MDNLVFEESVNTEIDQSEFISKKWVYVNDNNNGNYTSQIVLDSTPLSNAGGYINWEEGYMVMPLVVQLTSATAGSLPIGTKTADYAWGFKSGFWNLLNSMTIEFNNQNIVQQTPFLNVFRSFKAQTSFSQDDLLNEGSTLGFHMDTDTSWVYNNVVPNTASAPTLPNANPLASCGVGLSNNRNAEQKIAYSFLAGAGIVAGLTTASPFLITSPVAGVPTGGVYGGAPQPSQFSYQYGFNHGLYSRQKDIQYDPVATTSAQTPVNSNQGAINSTATCAQVYRSYKRAQTQDGSIIWDVFAKLRLKDLSEYFSKTPLLKGSTMRFYINTNQSIVSFTTTQTTYGGGGLPTATGAPVLNILSTSVLGGLTQPLMVASNAPAQGCSPLANDTYTLSVSIFKNNNSAQSAYVAGQSPLPSVRLYAPVYKFNPLAEQRYLSLAPTKKIEYNDIFQYQFNDIQKGQFNFLVTNGISNIQSVLVVPFLANSANGTPSANDGTAPRSSYSTLLSPTSTSGATPDPITLTNFNILVSGVNLFLNNEMYDFEQFNNELKSSNQLNGSLTTGLASGLISESMFSNLYRYYYGNCARILPSEAGVSRSIQLVGSNASEVPCNLMVFVEFKRSMTIDISTGARIE
jgi:hypothetical protein